MKSAGNYRLYGLPNCNTVKKAREWLARHGVEVEFHDFKKLGLEADIAHNWLQQADWNKLLNRSGLTWRGLPEPRKQQIRDAHTAMELMLEKTSVIKRPLLEQNNKLLHVGFDEAAYSEIFNLKS